MNIFRTNTIKFFNKLPVYRDLGGMTQFTDFHWRKQEEQSKVKPSSGRAWNIDELRIKSNEDLHKLWYVLLKEKNAIVADNRVKRKLYNSIGPQGRMTKVRVTMARLLTVINERKKIREQYRRHLEEEYIAEQRQAYEQKLAEERKQNELEPEVPEIDFKLLRAKYHDLKRGVDNTDYIKQALEIKKKKQEMKEYLDTKYNYKGKRIIAPENATDEDHNNPNVIIGFKSGIKEQLESGYYKMSPEEVLRSHVKNWKMLNLKQKRALLSHINARRAREAKEEFLKELSLLGQKIAYDNAQEVKAKEM